MKKLVKALRVVLIVIITVVLIFESYVFISGLKYANVFDEMIYSWENYSQLSLSSLAAPYFGNVKPLARQITHTTIQASEDFGFLQLIYSDDYMKQGTELYLSIYNENTPKGEKLHLRGIVEYSGDECLILDFGYDNTTRTLTLGNLVVLTKVITGEETELPRQYDSPEYVNQFLDKYSITKDEISEHRSYFLYDVAIGSWVDGNRLLSRFSKRHLGNFTIVDNTSDGLLID